MRLRCLAFATLAFATLSCATSPPTLLSGGPPDAGGCPPCRAADAKTDTATCSSCDAGIDATADGGCTTCEGGVDANSPLEECGSAEAGGPSLSSLSLKGATLVPPFSPSVSDYYVRCDEGALNLEVSMTAPSGTTTSLQVETPGAPSGTLRAVGSKAEQQTPVTLDENEALVATATLGTSSQEYWIRCVPPNFPKVQWTTHPTGCTRRPGYYLIGTMTGGKGFAIVFDTNGAPVWYADPGHANPELEVYDVETLSAGLISFSAGGWRVDQLGGATTYPVVDGYDSGTPVTPDEHELRILPNGHYIGFSSAGETVNLTGVTVPAPGGGVMTYGPDTTIYACYIQEFDPTTGTIYWEWSATDHFNPATAWVLKGDGDLAETSAEPFHCNSIDVDPANGNLLVSARHMNSAFYIEKATKKVLWKMGGSDCSSTEAGAKACYDDPPPVYVPVDDPFFGQHDARLQPGWKQTCSGGSGQISLFDDESYQNKPARGVVYDVTVAGGCGDGGASTVGKTGAKRWWQYKNWVDDGGVPSNVTGSFRIGKDGSRVIGWGQSDPTPNGLVFTEVDDLGNDLLDLICPDGSSSYRAVKVPLTAFDRKVLRTSSGL